MPDPYIVSLFAKKNDAGELDEIKLLFDDRTALPHKQFIGGINWELGAIIGFCEVLATIAGGANGIDDLIKLTRSLVKWVRSLGGSGSVEPTPLALRERVLVLLFEAQVNRNAGVAEPGLVQRLACDPQELAKTLGDLNSFGIVRQTAKGDWKYAGARS